MSDAEMSEYIINWFSYVVSSERNDHQFVNFIGKVRNGKSLLLHLFKSALGPYVGSPFVKNISANKGQLEAPFPNMAGCRGALLANCYEPEAGDMLQVGVLK
jgi:hypothetical protein